MVVGWRWWKGGRISVLVAEIGQNAIHRGWKQSVMTVSSVPEAQASKAAVHQRMEEAAREDRLDFITAANILFSTPAKPRKFGLDFHLWQFFVACLPPFAVYLTAQYSRREMRRMEKEKEEAEKQHALRQMEEQQAVSSALGNQSDANFPWTKEANSSTQEQKAESHNKSKEEVGVAQSENEILEMKSRLEIMEAKLRQLEVAQMTSSTSGLIDLKPIQSSGADLAQNNSSIDLGIVQKDICIHLGSSGIRQEVEPQEDLSITSNQKS